MGNECYTDPSWLSRAGVRALEAPWQFEFEFERPLLRVTGAGGTGTNRNGDRELEERARRHAELGAGNKRECPSMRWKRGEGRTSSVNKGTLLPAKDVTPAWERGAIVSHDGWRWEGEGRLVPRSLGRGTRSSVLHPLNTFLSHFSRSCEFESPESRT